MEQLEETNQRQTPVQPPFEMRLKAQLLATKDVNEMDFGRAVRVEQRMPVLRD